MPGETEERPSGWTIDTARADILSRLSDMDRRYEQRFDAQEKAVQAALKAVQEAGNKLETATAARFASLNEFQATFRDLTTTMMPRGESTARWTALADRVDKVEKAIAADSGRSQGVNTAWGYLAGAVGLASAVVAIILAFNK